MAFPNGQGDRRTGPLPIGCVLARQESSSSAPYATALSSQGGYAS